MGKETKATLAYLTGVDIGGRLDTGQVGESSRGHALGRPLAALCHAASVKDVSGVSRDGVMVLDLSLPRDLVADLCPLNEDAVRVPVRVCRVVVRVRAGRGGHRLVAGAQHVAVAVGAGG